MDVFALRDSVLAGCERFAPSFTSIRAEDLRQMLRSFGVTAEPLRIPKVDTDFFEGE